MSFACATGKVEGRFVLELEGEMDIDTVPAFVTAGLESLDRMPAGSALVLDLSRLTFMDCSGIGALLATRRAALARGCQVVVTGAAGGVQKLMRLTSTESLFCLELPTIVLPRETAPDSQLAG